MEGIKQEAYNHFCSMYQEEGGLDEEKVAEFFNPIEAYLTMEDNHWLVREVNEEEMAETVWGLTPDKVPGPYGFSFCFYRALWN